MYLGIDIRMALRICVKQSGTLIGSYGLRSKELLNTIGVWYENVNVD
jgi:hypothetical protein